MYSTVMVTLPHKLLPLEENLLQNEREISLHGIGMSPPATDAGMPPSNQEMEMDDPLFVSSGTELPATAGPQSSAARETRRVLEVIALLAELDPEELTQVLRCSHLQGLYQVRPKVTMRKQGKVTVVLGPVLGEEEREAEEADEDPMELVRPPGRSRIQSRRLVEDSEEEQERERVGEEQGMVEPSATAREEGVRDKGRRSRAATASQGDAAGRASVERTEESVSLLDRIDNVSLAPSTARAAAISWPHEWLFLGLDRSAGRVRIGRIMMGV